MSTGKQRMPSTEAILRRVNACGLSRLRYGLMTPRQAWQAAGSYDLMYFLLALPGARAEYSAACRARTGADPLAEAAAIRRAVPWSAVKARILEVVR